MMLDFKLPEDANVQEAELWLRQLYRDFGFGFHLDTPACEYVDEEGNSFTEQQCEDLDGSIDRLFDLLADPYAIAVEEMEKMIEQGVNGQ